MTTVTIIGSGNMGQALAALARRGGSAVQVLDTSTPDEQVTGEVVVLAVPYPAVSAMLAERGADLAGRVVVDITNPVDFATFDSLVVPAHSSAAAVIAARLPESRVIKAFNTNLGPTLASGTVGPVPTTVLIAGDDAEAKRLLAGIVSAGGLRAVDAGSLARARELEALGFLQITLAAREEIDWTGGFAVAS